MKYPIAEHVLVAQLRNIAKAGPVFPGNTLSHEAANECERRGYVRRNDDGDWTVTIAGGAYLHSPFVQAGELLPLVQAHADRMQRLLGELVHVVLEPLVLGQTGSMSAVIAHGPGLLREIKEALSPVVPAAQEHSTRLTAEAVNSGSEDDGPDFAAGVRFACGWLVAVLLRLGDDRIRGIPYCRAMHDAAQLAAFGAGEPPAELPRSSVGLDALLDWLSRPLP